jgi:hypothetical protein
VTSFKKQCKELDVFLKESKILETVSSLQERSKRNMGSYFDQQEALQSKILDPMNNKQNW